MSALAEVGSTWPGKVDPFAEVTRIHFGDPDVHVTPHDTGGRSRAPSQPMTKRDLYLGAAERLRATIEDTEAAGIVPPTGDASPPVAVGGAECGVVFSLKDRKGRMRPGFYSSTVTAVAVFDANGLQVGVGEAGGVRYPARDVVRSWASRGRKTIGQAMSERLGGDPQDPHAMLGKGNRSDQIRSAYENAFKRLRPVTVASAGSTVR